MEKQTNTSPFEERADEFLELVKYVVSHMKEGRMPATKEFSEKFLALSQMLNAISEERMASCMEQYDSLSSRLREDPCNEDVRKSFDEAGASLQTGIFLTGAAAIVTACFNNYCRGVMAAAQASDGEAVIRATLSSRGVSS